MSTLTFTLANGAGNPAQSGIDFTDTLPANVVIAGTPNVTSSCPSGTGVVTATAGTGVVTVAGATMNATQASCTVTVDVTSNTAGTYNNTNAGNISGQRRVDHDGRQRDADGAGAADAHEGVQPVDGGGGAELGAHLHDHEPCGGAGEDGSHLYRHAAGRRGHRHAQRAGERLRRDAHDHGDGRNGVLTVGGTGVNAAIGASTCTITVNVTSATAGAYVNGAAQVTAISGMTNGVTNQTLTVTQAALTKAFAPATINQGGVSTLTFTLANGAGNPAQSGINFTDTLPANVVIAGTPNVTQSSCPSAPAWSRRPPAPVSSR